MKCSCSGSVPSFTQGTDPVLRAIYTGTDPVLMPVQMQAIFFARSKAESSMIPPERGGSQSDFYQSAPNFCRLGADQSPQPPWGSLQIGSVLYAKLTRIAMSHQKSMLAADLPSAHTPSDSDTSGQTPWPA